MSTEYVIIAHDDGEGSTVVYRRDGAVLAVVIDNGVFDHKADLVLMSRTIGKHHRVILDMTSAHAAASEWADGRLPDYPVARVQIGDASPGPDYEPDNESDYDRYGPDVRTF